MRLQADDRNLQDRDGDAGMVPDSPAKRGTFLGRGNFGIIENKMQTSIWAILA